MIHHDPGIGPVPGLMFLPISRTPPGMLPQPSETSPMTRALPQIFGRFRRRLLGGLLVLLTFLPVPVLAQGLLRDAEIEHGLNLLAKPILTAAGLPANRTKVLVVNDDTLNAFVINGKVIYINAGLLMKLKSADQVQAVMAHETGHIANSHFTRRQLNAQNAKILSGLGAAAAVAVGAATQNPGLGVGLAIGSASAAQRNFLAHTRAEEASADGSGIRYMARAGIDPVAFRQVLDMFEGEEEMTVGQIDPYAVSHPLSKDRLRAVDQTISAIEPRTSDRVEADYWFSRVQAKVSSYMRSPAYTFGRLKASDTSDAAEIARAMAYFKTPDLANARVHVTNLIEKNPADPYFQELSGWIEIESGKVGPAMAAYAKAVDLAPNEPQILAGYGRALLANNEPATDAQALEVLEKARSRDGNDSFLLRDLSIAYARAGNMGMASLATAERYALAGSAKDVDVHAERAAGQLPVGSPGWTRAQDLISAVEPVLRKEKRR